MAPNPAFDPIIGEASRRYGVPEEVIRSVMRVESGGRERAVSPKGASGLMQVMPETYNELARKHGLGPDRFDPRNNILGGTAYLRENYDRFGNWTDALSAYNAGPNRVQRVKDGRSTMPAETQAYVPNVQSGMGGGMTREAVVNELRRRGKLPPEYDTPAPAPQQLTRDSVIAELKRRGKLPPEYDTPAPTPAAPHGDSSSVSSFGELWRGFQTGVDQLQGGIGYGLEAIGDKTGWQGLEDYGQGIRESNAVEQKQTPARVGRLEDIHSVGDFADWAAYTIGTLGPQIGAAVAAAGAATLAAPAVGVGAGVAGLAAAGAVSFPMNGSEVFQNLLDKGIDHDTAMNISLAAAGPMAALDAIVPGKAAGRVVGNAVTHTVAPTLVGKVIQGGTRVLKDAATEGATEATQEVIGIGAEGYAGVAPTVGEAGSRILNAGAAGAIGGGGIGVVTAPLEMRGGQAVPPPAAPPVPPVAPPGAAPVPPGAAPPPVTPGPTAAAPASPPVTPPPTLPGYRPFLDQDGTQIGWQSPDGSEVIAVDAVPPPATQPDLRTELNQVITSTEPVETIVAGNDLHGPLAGEIEMDGYNPLTGEEEAGFYHEANGVWRRAGDPPTATDLIGVPPAPVQPQPASPPVELPPIPPEVQAAADRSRESLAVKGTSAEPIPTAAQEQAVDDAVKNLWAVDEALKTAVPDPRRASDVLPSIEQINLLSEDERLALDWLHIGNPAMEARLEEARQARLAAAQAKALRENPPVSPASPFKEHTVREGNQRPPPPPRPAAPQEPFRPEQDLRDRTREAGLAPFLEDAGRGIRDSQTLHDGRTLGEAKPLKDTGPRPIRDIVDKVIAEEKAKSPEQRAQEKKDRDEGRAGFITDGGGNYNSLETLIEAARKARRTGGPGVTSEWHLSMAMAKLPDDWIEASTPEQRADLLRLFPPALPVRRVQPDVYAAYQAKRAKIAAMDRDPARPPLATFNEARDADVAALEALNPPEPEPKRPFPQTVSMVEKDLQNRKTKPNTATIARQYDLTEEEAQRVLASIAGRSNTVIRQTKAGRFRLTPRSDKTSLINLLASKGGLAPNGDLSAQDLDKVRTPGNGGMLVRKGGMTLDAARELAEEEGFIGSSDDYQTSNIQELLDAIEEEHRGSKVSTADKGSQHGPERQQMESAARALGIEVQDDWTDAELAVEIGEADAVRRGDPSTSADVDEATIQALLEDMGIFDRSIFSTVELTDFDIPFPDDISGTQPTQGSEGEVAPAAGDLAEAPRPGPEGQAGAVRQGDSAPEARTGEPDKGPGGSQQKPTPPVEKTDQGDQYTLLSGASKPETMTGKVPQAPADEGLFAKPAEPEPEQLDIEDAAAPKESRLEALKKRIQLFASGMTRPVDIKAGSFTWGGLKTRGIGIEIGELSRDGMEAVINAVVDRKASLFVDSGAFNLFMAKMRGAAGYDDLLKDLGPAAPKPLNFNQILKRYDALVEMIHDANAAEDTDVPKPLLVMPDIVGDQAGSLELVEKKAKFISADAEMNVVQPIVPIQKGELSLSEVYDRIVKILGTDNFIVGIPGGQKAVTLEELREFLTKSKPPKIHILGNISPKTLDPKLEVIASIEGYDPIHVSADGNLLRSKLYGLEGTAGAKNRAEAVSGVLRDRAGPEFDEQVNGPQKEDPFLDLLARAEDGDRVAYEELAQRAKAAVREKLRVYAERGDNPDTFNISQTIDRGGFLIGMGEAKRGQVVVKYGPKVQIKFPVREVWTEKATKTPTKINEIKAADLAGLDEASIDAILDQAFGGEEAAAEEGPKIPKQIGDLPAARALFDKHFAGMVGGDEMYEAVEPFITGEHDFKTAAANLKAVVREAHAWRGEDTVTQTALRKADAALRALKADMKGRGLSTTKQAPKPAAKTEGKPPPAQAKVSEMLKPGDIITAGGSTQYIVKEVTHEQKDGKWETTVVATPEYLKGEGANHYFRELRVEKGAIFHPYSKQTIKKVEAQEESKKDSEQSAADILKKAGEAGVKGADQALTGLYKLFGGNKLSSGFTFDEDTYRQAKPHFQEAYRQFATAGKSLLEFAKFINANFGESARPYLKRFLTEGANAEPEQASPTFTADAVTRNGNPDSEGNVNRHVTFHLPSAAEEMNRLTGGRWQIFGSAHGRGSTTSVSVQARDNKGINPVFQVHAEIKGEAAAHDAVRRALADLVNRMVAEKGNPPAGFDPFAKVDAKDEPVVPPPAPEPEPSPPPKKPANQLDARQISSGKERLREYGQHFNSALRDHKSDAHEVARIAKSAQDLARVLVNQGGLTWTDVNDALGFIGDQETSAGLGIHLAEDGWKFTFRDYKSSVSAYTTHPTFGGAFAALRSAKEAVNRKAVEEREKEPEGSPAVETAPEPAPGTDIPTGERVDDASVLASHGLVVKKVTTKNGKAAWEVTGNTYPVKDFLKGLKASFYKPKQAWTFWGEKDPTEAIAAKLRGEAPQGQASAPGGSAQPAGSDGKRPGNDPRSRRKSSSDARLRAVRQREDARNDERGDVRNVGSWVLPETQELIRRGLKYGMPEEVVAQQIEDVGLIHKAFSAGKKLFLLASEAGTGKTYVLGGSIRELRNAGANNFIYVTMNQDLIGQIQKDLEPYGIGDVQFYTYSDLSKKAPEFPEGTVLIFDETQNIKDPSSSRGKSGQQMIAQAKFTIFASATPFENPVQAKYLQATGIFDNVGGHTDWAKMYGASVRKIESYNYKTGKKEVVEVPYWQGGKSEDGIAARTWFMKQGIMTQRAKKLPPNMVDSTFRKTDVPKEWLDKYESVEAAYTEALRQYQTPDGKPVNSKIFSMISMHRINMIKRILEASKVNEAIARAKHHLSEGKQVVIFVETKADREVGKFRKTGDSSGPVYSYPEMALLMQRWELTRKVSEEPPPFSDAILAIALAMHNLGVSFTLPSTTDEIVAALGKDNVAIYTGAVTGAAASKNKADFLAKKKSVLIATMAKGGTGLSLHDTKGDSPRVQIGLNLPWVASAVDQVSGRIARYGLQSKALIEWLFAGNVPFERSLAQRVGGRMRDMGALVKGIDLQAAGILTEFNLEEETLLPVEGQAAEIKEEEAGGEPTRAELLAMAEKLERTRKKADDTSGGFFATPYPLAVAMRFISGVFAGDRVLEPSAGHGALVRFLPDNVTVDMVEQRHDNAEELTRLFGKKEGHNVVEGDFLELADESEESYDTILMNPPFERLAGLGPQDIAHVRKAYDLLTEGGRLVAIMGEGPFFREQRQDAEFRDWLEERGAIVVKLPNNTFKNSGTGVNARMVVIDEGAQPGRTDINLHDVDTSGLNTLINAIPVRERDRHGVRFDYAQDDGSGLPMPDVPLPGQINVGSKGFFFDGDVAGDFTQLTSRTQAFDIKFQPEFEAKREQVAREIGELAERIGGSKMPVQVFDRIFFRPQDKSGPVSVSGAQVRQGPFAGLVALAMTAPDIHGTLRHEAIHWLREAGLLDGADWRALQAHAAEWRKQFYIDERYGAAGDEVLNEEGIAEAYKAWANGELEAKGPILRAFQKMQRFFEAVRNLLAGNGFTTANSIFQKIETGEMANADQRANSQTAGDRGAAAEGTAGARFMLPPPRQGNLGQPYTAGQPNPPPGPTTPAAPVNQGNLFSVRTHLPDRSMVDWLTDTNHTLIDRIKGASSKAAIGVSVDRVRQLTQDRYIRLRRVQEAVAAGTGRVVPQAENAYLSEELFSSKAMEKMFRMDRDHKKPILQAIHAAKVTVSQVEKYLYARHATERNARISQINPRFQPGEGSGMTDADAAGIINAFQVMGILPQLDHIASLVDAMTSATLDERVAGGLMSQQEALRWRQTYRHYVPLRGIKELDDSAPEMPRGGQGYNVRGPESQRALGRKSRAEDSILSNIFMQADEAIIRSEKNGVLLTLLNLVQNAADQDYWVVNKVTIKPRFNKVTGLVEYKATGKLSKEEEDRTVRLKVNGHEHRITIFDGRLMAALKNLEATKVNWLLRGMMTINRYLSTVNTGLNPEFLVTNALRDLQSGFINMNAADIAGLKKAVLRDYGKALKGAWNGVQGKNNTVWAQHFRDFAAAGGRVSFYSVDNLDEHKTKIETELKKMSATTLPWKVRNGLGSILDLIGDANAAVDNGIRLSVFVNAKRLGKTDAEAASLAKNLTINFNRHGELGPVLNALYLFYNAGVQGTAVLFRALKHRKVQKIAAGIVAAGFIMEMVNAALSPDDDDGEDVYGKISDFTKSRNFIVMSPDGTAITIPMPYGYNVFADLGRNIAALVRGHQTVGATLGNILKTSVDAFNPIGGTQSLLNFISPTVIDPLVDLTTNRDYAGRQISPETPNDKSKPDSEKYWSTTGTMAREPARLLNELTGGNEFRSGGIDVSPETLEYWWSFLTGGAGTFFVTKLGGMATKFMAGDPVVMNDVPFARKVITRKGPGADRSLFYERAEQIEALQKERKGLGKSGRKEEADQIKIEDGDLLRLANAAEKIRENLATLRRIRNGVRSDGSMTSEERAKRLDELTAREKRQIDHFNQAYVAKVLKPRQQARALFYVD